MPPTPEQRSLYNRRYYERGGAAKIKQRNLDAFNRNRLHVRRIKEASGCVDCKAMYPHYVLQFDHIGNDKTCAVSALVGQRTSIKRLDEEIAKCEVVCANCHAERTWARRINGGAPDS